MNNQITIELISTFTCKRCVKAQQEIQALISACNYDINYKEVNVLEQIDYAVKLGVLRTPAIAINGELVFHSIPSKSQFQHALQKFLN
jgi:predicted thioredoxin/glutaredoxin